MNDTLIRKFIGYYQVIGGLAGIAVLFSTLASDAHNASLALMLFVTLSVFSVIVGVLTLRNERTWARLSLVNQLLQTFYISMPGFLFSYCAGVRCTIRISTGEDFLHYYLGISSFEFSLGSTIKELSFGVNIIALLLCFLLVRILNGQDHE